MSGYHRYFNIVQRMLVTVVGLVLASGCFLAPSVIGGGQAREYYHQSPHKNSVLMPTPTKYNNLNSGGGGGDPFIPPGRRLGLREREVMPPMSNNVFPGEPSCEELRAMWRYYKRQSRAELTNEVPRFGSNLFGELPIQYGHQQQQPFYQQTPMMSSFGPVGNKGRSKAQRLRLKTQKNPSSGGGGGGAVYGQVVHKPDRSRNNNKPPRPMEEVVRLMGKQSSSSISTTSVGGGGNKTGGEGIVHVSPPASPTKESSLQKIKQVFREERIREKGPAMRVNDDNEKAFGRIILSPPRGMDGRVANKPRELMTPFEKIRFGHADDILDDETRPSILFKRTSSFPNPLLNANKMTFITRDSSSYDFPSFQPHPPPPPSSLLLPSQSQAPHHPQYFSPWGINDFLHPTDHRQQAQPAIEISHSPTCKEMEGQPCRVNADCSCVGFGLYRCFANECQVLSLLSSTGVVGEKSSDTSGDDDGESSGESFWHSEPLDTNHLGLWEDSSHISNINSPAAPDETYKSSGPDGLADNNDANHNEQTYDVRDAEDEFLITNK